VANPLNYCPQAAKEQEQKEKEAARAKAEAEAKVSACPQCLAYGCCQAFAGPQTMAQRRLAHPTGLHDAAALASAAVACTRRC
jgi:hypothetical protein